MADFDVNTITAQGAIAIASATAGDKLVIDGCDATTQVLTKAQAVQIGTRPVSPASTTTSVALAGSTDNHVYAYASFIKGETGQPGGDVHSFFLYGHIESMPSSIIVIAIASATDDIHLPTSSDVTNRTEIQFELTFSATDEVVTVADTSMYTTRGEFLILKNRTVTTHAEGEATTGEDQSIYGDKNFVDTISLNDAYKMQATVTTSSGTTTEAMMLTSKTDYGNGPFVMANREKNGSTYSTSDVTIGARAGLNLGESAIFTASHVASSNKCTASMVSSGGVNQPSAGVEVEKTGITLYTTTDGSLATKMSLTITNSEINFGELSLKGSKFFGYGVECDTLSVNTTTLPVASFITVENDLVPVGGQSLGNTSTAWSKLYAGKVNCADLYVDTVSPKTLSNVAFMSSVYPFTADSFDLGDSNHAWNHMHCGEVVTAKVTSPSRTCELKASQSMIGEAKFICDIDSAPVQARIHTGDADSGETADYYFDYAKFYASSSFDNVDLGTDDHKFGTVYARYFRGCIPTVDGTTEPGVGAIFFAGIEVAGAINAGIGRTAKVGSPLIPGGSNITAIGPAIYDAQTDSFSAYTQFNTTAGTYKLLCGATKSGNEAACFALVMRIA